MLATLEFARSPWRADTAQETEPGRQLHLLMAACSDLFGFRPPDLSSFWRQRGVAAGKTQGGVRGDPKPQTKLLRVSLTVPCFSDFPFPAPSLIPLSSSPQPGPQSHFWLFHPAPLCLSPDVAHLLFHLLECRSLLEGLPATRSVFPARSCDHVTRKRVSVPICVPHTAVRTPSVTHLKGPSLEHSSPIRPGTPTRLKAHSLSVYRQGQGLRFPHRYVSPEPS